jgi:hypothetical protein
VPGSGGGTRPLGARIITACHALLGDGRSIEELRDDGEFDPLVVEALALSAVSSPS